MLHNVVQANILQKFEESRVKRTPLKFTIRWFSSNVNPYHMAIVEDVELNVCDQIYIWRSITNAFITIIQVVFSLDRCRQLNISRRIIQLHQGVYSLVTCTCKLAANFLPTHLMLTECLPQLGQYISYHNYGVYPFIWKKKWRRSFEQISQTTNRSQLGLGLQTSLKHTRDLMDCSMQTNTNTNSPNSHYQEFRQ